MILQAELELRGEFGLTGNGFSEFKRGFWAARTQMREPESRKDASAGAPWNDTHIAKQMTFKIYTNTGENYGPFGSIVLAQKHARAKFAENKKIEAIELRPSISSATGGYGPISPVIVLSLPPRPTRMKAFCQTCGYGMDDATAVPDEGVCLNCGELAIFTSELGLRPATAIECGDLPESALFCQLAIRQRGKFL